MKIINFFGLLLAVCLPVLILAGCTNQVSPSTPASTPAQVPYQQMAEEFTKSSPTFKYDGIPGSLKFTKIVGSVEGEWEFTIEYQTGHAGHGDRTGQVLSQVVTVHSELVRVRNGALSSAVCDGVWDMLVDKNLTGEESAGRIAQDFIENSSTFKFDGIKDSIKVVGTEPGWTSSFRSLAVNLNYQTSQPGHGDRTGKVLAQVITGHSAVVLVNIEKGVVAMAVCDKTWDMVNDKNPPVSVTGIVIGGGDTIPPNGPRDAPRLFVYEVKKTDGSMVKVAYTAYPPSPVGDANRAKVTLEFSGGSVAVGDIMEALGRMDKETNTVAVGDQGDYIKTFPPTPLPIISENVSWKVGDAVVAATLTRPDDKDRRPGLVFVAGSGPTDRDWNSPLLPGNNGSAKLLAEELAKAGYVTIRYDKRVAGPNAQSNLPLLVGKISMETHVDELAGAVAILLARPDVNREKIFVIANSEGTIHALNYQITREPKFAGIILEGMPGRKLVDLVHSQLEAQVASLPNAKEIMAGFDKLMADFLANKPFAADPMIPEGFNNLVKGFYVPINLPFTREFFVLDPAPLLGKVKAPTLVMTGKKDIQVDYLLDGSLLETAAQGHGNISFVYPENANHVLKYESRPREALSGVDALTYNASDRILDKEALQIIKRWLLQNN